MCIIQWRAPLWKVRDAFKNLEIEDGWSIYFKIFSFSIIQLVQRVSPSSKLLRNCNSDTERLFRQPIKSDLTWSHYKKDDTLYSHSITSNGCLRPQAISFSSAKQILYEKQLWDHMINLTQATPVGPVQASTGEYGILTCFSSSEYVSTIYIYIYIYMCVCVCVCELVAVIKNDLKLSFFNSYYTEVPVRVLFLSLRCSIYHWSILHNIK